MKTLLAIGAHYDDCIFGVPGILLKAVRKHYRVVALHLIGDYSNWAPAAGRERELVEFTTELFATHGVEAQFLDFASHRFDARLENREIVARAVAKVRPDIGLTLWQDDNHHDHIVASELSGAALRHAGQIVGDNDYRPPKAIYHYDNGPRHTIGFVPNTFVDISGEWDEAMDWLGNLNAWVHKEPFEPGTLIGSMKMKETLARYRGATCGAVYAEALWNSQAVRAEIL